MYLTIGSKDPVNKILWDELKAVRASGGFSLPSDIPSAQSTGWIFKGLPMFVDYASHVAEIVKTATVVAGSTTTNTRVEKGSLFIVGDVIANAVNGNAVAITAIDTSNESYDVLTHLTNGGAFAADSVVFEAGAVGTGDAAYKFTANSLLSDNTKILGTATVTAVIGAYEIQESNLPSPLTTEMKTALGARFQFV